MCTWSHTDLKGGLEHSPPRTFALCSPSCDQLKERLNRAGKEQEASKALWSKVHSVSSSFALEATLEQGLGQPSRDCT
jgi:hypothetical protein